MGWNHKRASAWYNKKDAELLEKHFFLFYHLAREPWNTAPCLQGSIRYFEWKTVHAPGGPFRINGWLVRLLDARRQPSRIQQAALPKPTMIRPSRGTKPNPESPRQDMVKLRLHPFGHGIILKMESHTFTFHSTVFGLPKLASFWHRRCSTSSPRTVDPSDETCVLKTCAGAAGHYKVQGEDARRLSRSLRPQQLLSLEEGYF